MAEGYYLLPLTGLENTALGNITIIDIEEFSVVTMIMMSIQRNSEILKSKNLKSK